MKAWLMDNDGAESPRAPHHRTPDAPVSLEELKHLGVLYWYIDPKEYTAGTSPDVPYPAYRFGFFLDCWRLCAWLRVSTVAYWLTLLLLWRSTWST